MLAALDEEASTDAPAASEESVSTPAQESGRLGGSEALETRTYRLVIQNDAEAKKVLDLLRRATPQVRSDAGKCLSSFEYDTETRLLKVSNTPDNLAVLEGLLSYMNHPGKCPGRNWVEE